ncbi:MAG: hypothetical protein Q9201_006650 [Fulgogasparrea decipioides]
MDSMRTLNTSLPHSPNPTSSHHQPPEQLLQAFKTAALSVTNLYKTAASDQIQARQNGYQEALDDILLFLDKENLGLDDGEGWKVRRWATERLDGKSTVGGAGAGGGGAGSESDNDERGETEKRARSSSPVIQYKSNTPHEHLQPRQHPGSTSPVRVTSAPPIPQFLPPQPPTSVPIPPAPEIFHFRSSRPLPQDVDMASSDTASTITTTSSVQPEIHNVPPLPTPPPSAAVRVEVLPRGSRTPHRNSHNTSKHNTRATTAAMSRRSLGTGAGSKRRFDFNDYFDLGNMGEGPGGGGGGGKRGRYE